MKTLSQPLLAIALGAMASTGPVIAQSHSQPPGDHQPGHTPQEGEHKAEKPGDHHDSTGEHPKKDEHHEQKPDHKTAKD